MEILNHHCRVSPERVIGPVAAIGLALVMVHCLTAASPAQPFDEYQVKAAFLYNFAKFVQWPSEAFQTATEPIAICVLGQDPFGRSLADTVAGRAIEGRSIVVRHISDIKQAAGCHVLFIASTENKRSPAILADIKPGILTVGDSDTSGTGVVINFRLDEGKVHFEIDVDAAEREKLQISSRLLSLAHIVESGRK
jgi:hypothetical protein